MKREYLLFPEGDGWLIVDLESAAEFRTQSLRLLTPVSSDSGETYRERFPAIPATVLRTTGVLLRRGDELTIAPTTFRATRVRETPKPPSLLKRAANAGRAAIRAAKGGFELVSEDIAAARLAICSGEATGTPCDRFNAEKVRCEECGCKLKLKSRMATEACPLWKWPVAENERTDGSEARDKQSTRMPLRNLHLAMKAEQ